MKAEDIQIALKQNQQVFKLGLLDDIKSDFSFIENVFH